MEASKESNGKGCLCGVPSEHAREKSKQKAILHIEASFLNPELAQAFYVSQLNSNVYCINCPDFTIF